MRILVQLLGHYLNLILQTVIPINLSLTLLRFTIMKKLRFILLLSVGFFVLISCEKDDDEILCVCTPEPENVISVS